jgi:iron complex outermembrane receptor protein
VSQRLAFFAAALAALPATAADSGNSLEEVVVQATLLRAQPLQDVPASVTVIDTATLRSAGEQHFEDVLALVPNLHWAGGTSRPRYFQIRGIGEREQYEGAPNSSVGFLVDDIDFSGIGMVATLLDASQVEVLRGPQGTRYGANALAGLISVRSAEPSREPLLRLEASAADYETSSLGVIASGPAERFSSAWRLAVQQYRSDGFRDDPFLNRDDTNGRDELTARARWLWEPSDQTSVELTLLRSEIDNGYDAWSVDNSWRSQADRPGEDSQRATAGSVRIVTDAVLPATLTVIGSHGSSKSVTSFDADWGNPEVWAPFTYDFFGRADRDRRTSSLEVRLASAPPQQVGDIAWLAGVYGLRLDEDGRDLSLGAFADPSDPLSAGSFEESLASRYRASNVAIFGQLDGRLTERVRWSAGLRGERREADYVDAGPWQGIERASDLDSQDSMAGGQLSLSFDVSPEATWYTAVSRGYKAGGFNLGNVRPERRAFEPEYLWSLEAGLKRFWLGGQLYSDTTLFYSYRRNVQVRTGEQLDPNDPNTYVFFTDNASGGYNYGLESSLRWRVSERWEFGGSLGLLRTRYLDYMQGEVVVPDREQAHAPQYQVALNGTWRHPAGWMARADLSAVDAFYFDVPPNDTRASSYSLVNLKAGYETERWSAFLWARNVFDEVYALRGFFFANDPADPTPKLYIQRGDPRRVGVSFTYSFR